MNALQFEPSVNIDCDATEVVRGLDRKFVEQLSPLVRSGSVRLNLSSVERIDAAGVAALITLYCDACKAGHTFTLSGARRHVREILALVGLDRLLITPPEAESSFADAQLQESAA